MVMASVDLFSGIGGFTIALDDICKPMMYCDNSSDIISALNSMMSSRKLPKAPVVEDARPNAA